MPNVVPTKLEPPVLVPMLRLLLFAGVLEDTVQCVQISLALWFVKALSNVILVGQNGTLVGENCAADLR